MAIKKHKRPTLKVIANIAGLGVTTVSKALKDAPDIADGTKQRVRLIAEQVGYRPDEAALRLRTGKTNILSFVMNTDDEVDHVTSTFILGITKALKSTPYHLVLVPVYAAEDPLVQLRHLVETRSTDGIILTRTEPRDQRLMYLDQVGMPFVTYGRSSMNLEHAYFDFDSAAFGKDAVSSLAQLGCKHVGVILPPMHLTYSQLIHEGFHQGVNESKLESSVFESITIEDSMEEISENICSAMKKSSRPDGIVCTNAKSTIATLNGIERAGLTVGTDLQLITKQSTANLLKWLGKPIYYTGEDFNLAGCSAAKSLLATIDGAPVTDHQTVAYTEIVGRSVLD